MNKTMMIMIILIWRRWSTFLWKHETHEFPGVLLGRRLNMFYGHKTCSMDHRTCSLVHTACAIVYRTCCIAHRTCSMVHWTCSMVLRTCPMVLRTCSMVHRTSSTDHRTRPIWLSSFAMQVRGRSLLVTQGGLGGRRPPSGRSHLVIKITINDYELS